MSKRSIYYPFIGKSKESYLRNVTQLQLFNADFTDIPLIDVTSLNAFQIRRFRSWCMTFAVNRNKHLAMTYFINLMNLAFGGCLRDELNILNSSNYKINTIDYTDLNGTSDPLIASLPQFPNQNDNAVKNLTLEMFCAVAGVVTLMIGKKLTDINAKVWIDHRHNAVCGLLGMDDQDRDTSRLFIDDIDMILISDLVTSIQPLQQLILSAVLTTKPSMGSIKRVADWCAEMLKFSQMGYIALIHKYLVISASPILMFPFLADEVKQLSLAYLVIGRLGDNACYAKLLMTSSKLSVLSRNNFKVLIEVSKGIGSRSQASLANFASPIMDNTIADKVDLCLRFYEKLSRNMTIDIIGSNTTQILGIDQNNKLLDIVRAVNSEEGDGGLNLNNDNIFRENE